MEITQEDICIVEQFRITEYQLMKNGKVTDTFFKIRDEQGRFRGKSFNRVQDPLYYLLGLMVLGCIDRELSK